MQVMRPVHFWIVSLFVGKKNTKTPFFLGLFDKATGSNKHYNESNQICWSDISNLTSKDQDCVLSHPAIKKRVMRGANTKQQFVRVVAHYVSVCGISARAISDSTPSRKQKNLHAHHKLPQ